MLYKKLSRCQAIWLLLAMFLILATAPIAQAQTPVPLKWIDVETPGARGNIIVTPSEVSKIAVGRGDIIYAIDSETSIVYRSDNAGLTWEEITRGLSNAGDALPATEIAVAPDKPQYVAVVNNTRTKVYLSTDNGATWKNTNVPPINGTIQCITISKSYRTSSEQQWDVAIGTANWGDNQTTGQVWVLPLGGTVSSWQNQNITVDENPLLGGDVSALAFSPSYSSDGIILAVASTGNDVVAAYQNKTWLCLGQRDLWAQTTKWNTAAGYANYPVEITTAGDDNNPNTRIISSIALPSDYLGKDFNSRKAIVSYQRQSDVTSENDVYRIVDSTITQKERLYVNGSGSIDISSISYYGTLNSGILLAGETDPVDPITKTTVQVHRASDPFPTPANPTAIPSWRQAIQPPTGPGNAQVAWSYNGGLAFCGTSKTIPLLLPPPPPPLPPPLPDESAFSRSRDSGDTWEQTSLIDTVIHISDIAAGPDSKSLFLATYSGFGLEGIWRTAGEPLGNFWGRILSMETTSDRLILRLSPDYITDYTLYAIEVWKVVSENISASMVMESENRGNSWHRRYVPFPIIDAALADKDTLHIALPDGLIRKSTNSGLTWTESPAHTGLFDINMLSITTNGHILVGSRDSKVAYSTDGGNSFIEIIQPIGNNYGVGAGDVQVVADANYSNNNIIYASDNTTDKGIWRWAIGKSSEWEQIDEIITDLNLGQQISGLVTGEEGTLYALRSENVTETSAGGMTRSLNPYQPYTPQVEFDIVNATLPTGITFSPIPPLPNILPQLKISDGNDQNQLWAVGNFSADNITTVHVYRFIDTLCRSGPVTNSPDQIGCDPTSGRSQEVNLCWEQLSLADAYDIEIAKDSDFTIRVIDWVNEHTWTGFLMPVSVTSPCVYFPAGGNAGINGRAASAIGVVDAPIVFGDLECGHTYYWRVRVRHAATTETIRSPWSQVNTFTIKAGLPVTADYYDLKLLSPVNGCFGCPVNTASFSWAPFKETTKYRFVLARDPAMTQVIYQAQVPSTAYRYNSTLDYSTNYFWHVMSLEPAPSDWSATFSFHTEAAPELPAQQEPIPPIPLWVWVVILIGIILIIVMLIMTFSSNRWVHE